MKWEYKTLSIQSTGFWVGGKIDLQQLTDKLNAIGNAGWELVSAFDTNMTHGTTRDVIAILKRSSP